VPIYLAGSRRVSAGLGICTNRCCGVSPICYSPQGCGQSGKVSKTVTLLPTHAHSACADPRGASWCLAESVNTAIASPAHMAAHQFHIGQTVCVRRSAVTRNAEAGSLRYRVKSLIEPHERVVIEQELTEA
jgi:hypothetical protein